MKNNWSKKIYWLFFILTIILLLVSCVEIDSFDISNTSVLLLLILILLPYFPLIKKIKFGDFEVEISSDEIDEIEKQAENVIDNSVEKSPTHFEEQLYELSENDVSLAFAKIRIEIEQKLKTLTMVYLDSRPEHYNLRRITDELIKNKIIDTRLGLVLRDIISIANRAIHGETINNKNVQKMISISIDAIYTLNDVIRKRAATPLTKKVIKQSDITKYTDARYEVKTITPYVKNPEIRIYKLNQTELDSFFEGYFEYAEFVISIKKIDEK